MTYFTGSGAMICYWNCKMIKTRGHNPVLTIITHNPDPTHQPTQQPIFPPMGGGASTNVESSNRIEISQLGQGIFDF